jgi:hypothetical protein
MSQRAWLVSSALIVTLPACSLARENSQTSTAPPADIPVSAEPTDRTASAESAKISFTSGVVRTMDDQAPHARTLAIRGYQILAMGSNHAVEDTLGAAATVVDLRGRTLGPGFIDSHQCRTSRRAQVGVQERSAILVTTPE